MNDRDFLKQHCPALADMIERRMENTGESFEMARERVIDAVRNVNAHLADGGAMEVFDPETGKTIGTRDAKGYHPVN